MAETKIQDQLITEKKDFSISIRLTKRHLLMLEAKAKASGMSRSDYLVHLLDNDTDKISTQTTDFIFTLRSKLPASKSINIEPKLVQLEVSALSVEPIVRLVDLTTYTAKELSNDFGVIIDNIEQYSFSHGLDIYKINDNEYWFYENIKLYDKKNSNFECFVLSRGKNISSYEEAEKIFGKYASSQTLSRMEKIFAAQVSADDASLNKFFF